MFGALTSLAAASVALPALHAQGRPERHKISIAVGGKAALNYLPLVVADQLGYFKAEGLDVELHDLADGAQANSFEGLPFFIGAVVIAHQLGAAQMWVDTLAVVYVLSRMAFIFCYVRDMPTARSAVWTLGLLANIGILLVGWRW